MSKLCLRNVKLCLKQVFLQNMSKTSIGSKIQSDERVSIFRYEITNAKIRIIIIIRIEADNTIERDKFNIHISRYSTENRVT